MSTDLWHPPEKPDSGSAGIVGELGGGWTISDREEEPFVEETSPAGPALTALRRTNIPVFHDREYASRWWAALALQEFLGLDWRQGDTYASGGVQGTDTVMAAEWQKVVENQSALTVTEVNDLAVLAANERSDALGEIFNQDKEFVTQFMSLLGMTPGTHPNTYRVIHIGVEIGLFIAMYYKGQTNRPRPSQVLPALRPPLPMPGHSSWPGGHATESWLIARCLEYVLEASLTGTVVQGLPPNSTAGTGDLGALSASLQALALRIARNREIAGLHYPSDSDASRRLAETIFQHLRGEFDADVLASAPMSRFGKAIALARKEWEFQSLAPAAQP